MELWVVWLIVAGILFVFEMMTLTFYLLWLGIGALAALAVALVAPEDILLQVVAGCLVALVLTVFSKAITKRVRSSKGFKDAVDEMVGKQGIVMENIDPGQYGIVKVGGDTWSATSKQTLKTGDRVFVVKRGNAILEVEKQGGD
ncbi:MULTISPECIES: NfeD family protein [unclassified Paenibacillus]|uniref:NfeD family protein n=1 Tax=unclassified Paenibacillus TaxID=185978 RepID=UPI001C0F5194|nr:MULTISPECIES: NfeD family protein [unclassified Paenibacillus]MBU5441849.1 NfeD family protein [Paenibacillus sp. MSJ-34]CAH0119894.1 hypothetical protein PAE9249_02402 [Paenibacillus sp. CECT 9249]